MITTINPSTAMENDSISRKRSADDECRKGAYIANDRNPLSIDAVRDDSMKTETPSKRLKGSFVTDLNIHDVLFGRGPQVHRNPGNMRFRDIIKGRFQEYLVTTRRGVKDQIARTIVQTVQSSGGRFLRKREVQASLHLTGADLSSAQLRQNVGTADVTNEDQKGLYIEVDNITAVEKVKQALRDCNLDCSEDKRSADSIRASDYTDIGSSQQQDQRNVTSRLSLAKHAIPEQKGDEVAPLNEAIYAQSKPSIVSSSTQAALLPIQDIDQIRAVWHSNQHSNNASSSSVLAETFKRIAETNLNDKGGLQTQRTYNGSPNVCPSIGHNSTLIQELQRSLQSYQEQMHLKEQANRITQQQQLALIRQQEIAKFLLQSHSTPNNPISHNDPIRALVQRLLVTSSSEEDRLQLLLLLRRMNIPVSDSVPETMLRTQQHHYPRGLESILNTQNYPSSLLPNAAGLPSNGMSHLSTTTNDMNPVISALQQRLRDTYVPNDIQRLLHRIESNKIPSPTMSMRNGIAGSTAILQNGYQQRTGSDGLNVFEPIQVPEKNSPESSEKSKK